MNLDDIIGGGEALAALATPYPAELTTDRVANLIDDVITELRDVIAHRAPGPAAEAATRVIGRNPAAQPDSGTLASPTNRT